ncbi:hypothetical protein GCM10027343_03770 [Noviherbaspirillum agri]
MKMENLEGPALPPPVAVDPGPSSGQAHVAAAKVAGEDAARPNGSYVFSVRTKGWLVLAALFVYGVMIALFVAYQKNLLLRDFEQIQESLEIDSLLKQADTAAFHAMMGVFANVDAVNPAGMQRIQMHYQILKAKHAELHAKMPEFDLNLDDVEAALHDASLTPSRETMNRLITALVKTKNEFTSLADQSQEARTQMSQRYEEKANSVARTTLMLGVIGLALLGMIMMIFFKRLVKDLNLLQARALAIVNGYRGAPLRIRRHDEVGDVMRTVNNMTQILDKREKELIVERQKYFHQEKMAAIGALAAGVAHEIGNPIAAISGIAQEMKDRREAGMEAGTEGEAGAQDQPCREDLIQEQTERLAAIIREISDFASPQMAEPQFLDLNAQLRSTASLIRYDKRAHSVDLRLELDPTLPAIYGVADQYTQVVMNLLINAMDALETVKDRQPEIIISTRNDGGRVCMVVEDNGPGMEPAVRERAFDAFFTTKPAGKGTGLGLSLCYSIMDNQGGSIDIDSAPGAGTRVRVYFPINETT